MHCVVICHNGLSCDVVEAQIYGTLCVTVALGLKQVVNKLIYRFKGIMHHEKCIAMKEIKNASIRWCRLYSHLFHMHREMGCKVEDVAIVCNVPYVRNFDVDFAVHPGSFVIGLL